MDNDKLINIKKVTSKSETSEKYKKQFSEEKNTSPHAFLVLMQGILDALKEQKSSHGNNDIGNITYTFKSHYEKNKAPELATLEIAYYDNKESKPEIARAKSLGKWLEEELKKFPNWDQGEVPGYKGDAKELKKKIYNQIRNLQEAKGQNPTTSLTTIYSLGVFMESIKSENTSRKSAIIDKYKNKSSKLNDLPSSKQPPLSLPPITTPDHLVQAVEALKKNNDNISEAIDQLLSRLAGSGSVVPLKFLDFTSLNKGNEFNNWISVLNQNLMDDAVEMLKAVATTYSSNSSNKITPQSVLDYLNGLKEFEKDLKANSTIRRNVKVYDELFEDFKKANEQITALSQLNRQQSGGKYFVLDSLAEQSQCVKDVNELKGMLRYKTVASYSKMSNNNSFQTLQKNYHELATEVIEKGTELNKNLVAVQKAMQTVMTNIVNKFAGTNSSGALNLFKKFKDKQELTWEDVEEIRKTSDERLVKNPKGKSAFLGKGRDKNIHAFYEAGRKLPKDKKNVTMSQIADSLGVLAKLAEETQSFTSHNKVS